MPASEVMEPPQPRAKPPPRRPMAKAGHVENFDERPAVAATPVSLDEMLKQGDHTGGIVVATAKPAVRASAAAATDASGMTGWEKELNALVTRLAPSDAGVAEALAGPKLAEYKEYVIAFGSYATAALHSKRWQLREAALRALSSKEGYDIVVGGKGCAATTFVTTLLQYIAAKSHGIEDTISNVFFTTCDGLKQIVCEELSDQVPVASVANQIQQLLPDLLLRAGDNNQRIREHANTVLMLIAMSPFGAERVATAALNEPETVGKKPQSHRVQLARIGIVSLLLEKAGLNRKDARTGLTVDGIMTRLVLPLLGHSHNEVREASISLIVALYRMSTPAVMDKFLANIKPAQKALIDEQIGKDGVGAGGAGVPGREAEMASSSVSISREQKDTHPMVQAARAAAAAGGGGVAAAAPAPAAKPSAKKSAAKAEPAKPQVDEGKRCQFCGKYDARYTEHTLDQHYVRNCPMLCPCPLCGQVTEISLLQEHLVKECEKKALVRMCHICHEAVRSEDLDTHVMANACIPYNSKQYSVCPLCHAKFPPGEQGWDDHLLKAPGCRNNPRRFDGGAGEEFM